MSHAPVRHHPAVPDLAPLGPAAALEAGAALGRHRMIALPALFTTALGSGAPVDARSALPPARNGWVHDAFSSDVTVSV
jgi:hypothetical protein